MHRALDWNPILFYEIITHYFISFIAALTPSSRRTGMTLKLLVYSIPVTSARPLLLALREPKLPLMASRDASSPAPSLTSRTMKLMLTATSSSASKTSRAATASLTSMEWISPLTSSAL